MSENELNEIEWIAFFRLWELSVSLALGLISAVCFVVYAGMCRQWKQGLTLQLRTNNSFYIIPC